MILGTKRDKILLLICVACVHLKNLGVFPNDRPSLRSHREPNFSHLSAKEVVLEHKNDLCAHFCVYA